MCNNSGPMVPVTYIFVLLALLASLSGCAKQLPPAFKQANDTASNTPQASPTPVPTPAYITPAEAVEPVATAPVKKNDDGSVPSGVILVANETENLLLVEGDA